jgi:hypothetical protein
MVLSSPHGALATLGNHSDSIEFDRAERQGTVEIADMGNYIVYTITHGFKNQEVIREYVSSDDIVFAVAWSGSYMPNLSKLLDTKYQEYQNTRALASANTQTRLRSHVSRTESDGIVVVTTGHMRSVFRGKAFDPVLLKQLGVSENEIK